MASAAERHVCSRLKEGGAICLGIISTFTTAKTSPTPRERSFPASPKPAIRPLRQRARCQAPGRYGLERQRVAHERHRRSRSARIHAALCCGRARGGLASARRGGTFAVILAVPALPRPGHGHRRPRCTRTAVARAQARDAGAPARRFGPVPPPSPDASEGISELSKRTGSAALTETVAPCSSSGTPLCFLHVPPLHTGTSPLVLVAEDYGTIGMMLADELVEAGLGVFECSRGSVSTSGIGPQAEWRLSTPRPSKDGVSRRLRLILPAMSVQPLQCDDRIGVGLTSAS